MVTIIHIKWQKKYKKTQLKAWTQKDKLMTYSLFSLFFLYLQRSSPWGLCCSPWLTCSVSLWLSPFQKWYPTISSYNCRKVKCTNEGPLQPSPEFMSITILAQLHSAFPLYHHGFVTLSLLQIPLDLSSFLMSSKYSYLSQVSLHSPHLPALCLCTLSKGLSF